MRYLGAIGDATGPAVPLPQLGQGGPLDPLVKAQLLALAPQIPDNQAQDLLDFVDATNVGHKAKLMRYGIGAAGGVFVGLVLAKVLFK